MYRKLRNDELGRISAEEFKQATKLSVTVVLDNVRSQHNIENFIVDFYIAKKKIAIEIDGIQHNSTEHAEADRQRDMVLASWNIRVLRYSNESIRKNFTAVASEILKILELDFSDLKPL